ncbi:MAG: TIGR02147 family protein [Bdellovibrionaceae bacterium]|nr:TIGR02147 family protein [Bdellovibrionales bacterium]MCB9255470.1 TIGR02147 family protein [Pseudobdellovibrionaceae bacterium]
MDTRDSERPDIFRYHDYRVFLKDWFAFQKKTRRVFSLRNLSRKAKLASGYLPMVLSGARNLSSKAIAKLTPHLGLNPQECAYLDALKDLSDAGSSELQTRAFELLQKNRTYQAANPKEMEAYRYLTHWYYVAIREMATLPGFQVDAAWIQSRLLFKVPLKDIQSAVEFLLSHGFLEKDASGVVRAVDRDVDCLGGIFRLALGNFHRQMLGLAAESLEVASRAERSVEGYTLPIQKKDFPKVVAILKEAFQQIGKLENSKDASNEIYHVALSAFPVTKRGGG